MSVTQPLAPRACASRVVVVVPPPGSENPAPFLMHADVSGENRQSAAVHVGDAERVVDAARDQRVQAPIAVEVEGVRRQRDRRRVDGLPALLDREVEAVVADHHARVDEAPARRVDVEQLAARRPRHDHERVRRIARHHAAEHGVHLAALLDRVRRGLGLHHRRRGVASAGSAARAAAGAAATSAGSAAGAAASRSAASGGFRRFRPSPSPRRRPARSHRTRPTRCRHRRSSTSPRVWRSPPRTRSDRTPCDQDITEPRPGRSRPRCAGPRRVPVRSRGRGGRVQAVRCFPGRARSCGMVG